MRRSADRPGEIRWDPAAGSLDPTHLAGVNAVAQPAAGRTSDAAGRRRGKRRFSPRGSIAQDSSRAPSPVSIRGPSSSAAAELGIYGDRGDEILTEDSELGDGFLADVGKAWGVGRRAARAAGARARQLPPGDRPRTRRRRARTNAHAVPARGRRSHSGSGKQWRSWVAPSPSWRPPRSSSSATTSRVPST